MSFFNEIMLQFYEKREKVFVVQEHLFYIGIIAIREKNIFF